MIPNYLHGRINNCPEFYAIVSAAIPLNDPFAIATNGKYLYVTSAYDPKIGSGVVFVFDPAVAGSQTPVATIWDRPRSCIHPRVSP